MKKNKLKLKSKWWNETDALTKVLSCFYTLKKSNEL